jgi:hypothetical protein
MRNEVVNGSLAFALTALLAAGCAGRVEELAADVPRAAVPVAVDEVLKAGEDAGTRDRVAQILATPEMQQAIREIARGAVEGAIDEMSSEESQERIATLTHELATALRSELSAADRRTIEGAVAAIAASGTRGAVRTAANEIPTTLGPAVTHALVQELQDPALRHAVSGMVSGVTRDVLGNTRDAMQEARGRHEAEGTRGPIASIQRALTLSWLLAFGLGVIAVGGLMYGWRLKRRAKRYRLALVSALEKKNESEEERRHRLVEILQ